jgi:hypothetical protein
MGVFVSGLIFIYQDGKQDALGYIHQDQSVPIRFTTPQRIQGWQLALDTSGIRSIAVVTEDGTVSPWAGEPGDFPKWHLAEDEGITAVRAEFDVGFTLCQPTLMAANLVLLHSGPQNGFTQPE